MLVERAVTMMTSRFVTYPVILGADGPYTFVRVPDIRGGFTQGTDDIDALAMTKDLIGSLLVDAKELPPKTPVSAIKLAIGERAFVVTVDLKKFE